MTLDLLDIDSLLTEEELAIRAVVADVMRKTVRPHIAGWYESGEVPARELALEFGKVGLLGMKLQGYGCAGASSVAYGLACLELEAADSGIRSLVSVQGSLAMEAIAHYGSEEQRRRWLPGMATGELIGCFGLTEPDHGSDPASMSTRAVRDGDGWRLSGVKMWITNAPVADVAVIWARTDDGVRGFAVPMETSGVSAREVTGKLSLRASRTGEIVLDDVRLPADAQLPGATGLRAPLSCLTEARAGIAWGALGAARDCLQSTLDYATAREQFGRPIAGFQLTQAKLADMVLEWQKGLLLALHVARAADRGAMTPTMVSMAKLNSTREAIAIARQCRTIMGANGISGEYPVMRHANNLESVLTYEGTAEIHQLVIGQALTGLSAFA
ncbi:glutaryl-CoA dehydrogenase [Allocatelliglobosispora scoriae]|uniref:Glutaryl-CoA dehydrogenase n=1 Tax=Allocatelliglobosispora scoriae TaxID=643052 RepID=A0A841BQV1_9ACTN|nr:acyl-CoA dehydrogenase family protein [Allocatelliglobosispora scoriae]MBB5870624.1 glutaryl-CoA dehydrogenase [Allocatelliglobosispora scoriae]